MPKRILILLFALRLTSCISIELQTETPVVALPFVTSTLPPTKVVLPLPTKPPLTSATPEMTSIGNAPPNCKDRAVLLEDVSYPDNTSVAHRTHPPSPNRPLTQPPMFLSISWLPPGTAHIRVILICATPQGS